MLGRVPRPACIALAIGHVLWASSVARGEPPALRCVIVLLRGAFADGHTSRFLDRQSYFSEYASFFRARGCEVNKTELPDVTIAERADILKSAVERLAPISPDIRVLYLVAHSQGGLDARYAIKTLRLRGVKALLTVGTPHHGTPLAEWVVRERDEGTALYWFLRGPFGYDLRRLSFAGEMTWRSLEHRSSQFSAVPGVTYASARAVCRTECHWALRALVWWTRGDWAGDGIVPEGSQRFGTDLGEFDLDHISSVGVDRGKRAERRRLLEAMWKSLRHR